MNKLKMLCSVMAVLSLTGPAQLPRLETSRR